ncbi:hypothetical protein [Pandoraea sp. NE5]|uniref:hypothetical protein n=1 Tax=Pandoraea sp. NE5 TaxID=2904129 RepID=UPI0021C32675|nr:hypothetical protein [Pandoraea sp. NE5]
MMLALLCLQFQENPLFLAVVLNLGSCALYLSMFDGEKSGSQATEVALVRRIGSPHDVAALHRLDSHSTATSRLALLPDAS